MYPAARRRASQKVAVINSKDSASSQPPSVHRNGQNRLVAGPLHVPVLEEVLSHIGGPQDPPFPASCGAPPGIARVHPHSAAHLLS